MNEQSRLRQRPVRRPRAPWVLLAAVLSACSTAPVGPNYTLPAQAVAQQPAASAEFAGVATSQAAASAAGTSAALFSSAPLPPRWWRLYQDDKLDALIQKALAHNTDLRQAVANLERVREVEVQERGGDKPTLTLQGNPSFGHSSGLSQLRPGYQPPNTFNYSAGASLSYQMDLFGQLYRGIEAAQAGSQAAQAALDLARVTVAADTTRAYVQVCSAGLRQQTAQASVRLQEEAVGITERLQQAGRVGVMDAARARSQLALLKASIPQIEAERQNALFRLVTLTGELPQAFPRELLQCKQAPQVRGTVPVGDGAALLRRRPDIRQAERNLAEATARIGVVTADLYPKVSLGLSVASVGKAPGIAERDTMSWGIGPLISWSVPNTGVVKARIAQAEASTRNALAKFDGTVLTALREVETALTNYAHELDRLAALRASRDEAARVAAQSRKLYTNGRTAYLEALDADRALASSEASVAASQAQLADDQVLLFLALGGGWEPEEAASAATPASSPQPGP